MASDTPSERRAKLREAFNEFVHPFACESEAQFRERVGEEAALLREMGDLRRAFGKAIVWFLGNELLPVYRQLRDAEEIVRNRETLFQRAKTEEDRRVDALLLRFSRIHADSLLRKAAEMRKAILAEL